MPTNSSIDVIIPCYNTGHLLLRAVHSVLEQTQLPERIIIVDDGSTDNTLEICTKLIRGNKKQVIIHYHRQDNAGPNVARNTGIQLSQSEYIAFLDADDSWEAEKLEKQLHLFSSSHLENLGVVYCICDFIGENDQILSEQPTRYNLRGSIFDALTEANKITGSSSAVLIKRSCFEHVGVFDATLKAYEDWDLWLRLAQHYTFDYVDEVLVHIHFHDTNTQKNTVYMNRFALQFYKKWLPHINDYKPLREWAFQLAKPCYLPSWNSDYLQQLNTNLTDEEKKKLYQSTLGSLTLYAWLQRLRKKIQ
jgi:glycosyltransferase involved in cell wall biosynthesis